MFRSLSTSFNKIADYVSGLSYEDCERIVKTLASGIYITNCVVNNGELDTNQHNVIFKLKALKECLNYKNRTLLERIISRLNKKYLKY